MTTLLTAYNLSKSYNIYPIFEGVSFTINSGERVALVGHKRGRQMSPPQDNRRARHHHRR